MVDALELFFVQNVVMKFKLRSSFTLKHKKIEEAAINKNYS
jgi:hypothetical protein